MTLNPAVVELAAQSYAAISVSVPMNALASVGERIPEVYAWLDAQRVAPAGAPFFKYDVIDMDGLLQLTVGVPVSGAIAGQGDIRPGVFPAGRYVTVTHVGHPDELYGVTGALLSWAEGEGLTFDMTRAPDGEHWTSRYESYETDPRDEPDMAKWETVLCFKLT